MSRNFLFASLILTLCSLGAAAAAAQLLPPLPDAEESADELPPPDGDPTPPVLLPVLSFGADSLAISAGSISLSYDELADTATLVLVCDRDVQAGNLWYGAGQDLAFALTQGQDEFTLQINGQGGLTLSAGVYRLSARVDSPAGAPSQWVTIKLEVNAESAGSALAHSDLVQAQVQTLHVSGAGVGDALSASFGSNIQAGNLTRQDADNLVLTLTVDALAATGTRDFVLQFAQGTATGSVRVLLPANASAQAGAAPHRNAAQSHDGVLLADGAWRWQQCDLRTRGRKLDLAAERTYRGSGGFNGPMGRNWFSVFFESATLAGDTVTWVTGQGWVHQFTDAGDGLFLPPGGVYAVVRRNAATGHLALTERDGTQHHFAANGRLLRVQDRHGNATRLEYDSLGRLASITGDRGTLWQLAWHNHGRVASITDTSWSPPRVVEYGYDSDGNLASVKWPQTAAFNQARENRITWQFSYDAPGRLQRIVWPRQQADDLAGLTLAYDAQHRVVSLTRGELVTRLAYGSQGVDEFDPRGLRTCFELDQAGHATAVTRFNGLWEPGETSPVMTAQPLRGGESVQGWTTTAAYGANHEVTQTQFPGGRQQTWTFPEPDQAQAGTLTALDGRQVQVDGANWQANQWRNYFLRLGNTAATYCFFLIRGNSTDTLELWTAPAPESGPGYAIFKDNPDPLAAGNVLAHQWLGTGNEVEYEAFTYDAAYQLRKSRRDRGGAWWLYRFDHEGQNATGTGNEVEELSPPVTVPDPGAEPFTVRVRTTTRFNYQGQPTSRTDAEGVETTFSYFSEGASAGLPWQTILDAGGLALTRQFAWDAAGNPASQWSPRAFAAGATADDFRTDFVFNELGWQVHQTGPCLRVGGSDRADTHWLHDANGNVTHVLREYVTDAGAQPDAPTDPSDPATYPRNSNAMAATWIEETREYDLQNRQTALVEDAIAGQQIHRVRREYAYDASGNRCRETSPLGRVTGTGFDERNLALVTSLALGTPDQGDTQFSHDADGRLVACTDPRGKVTSRSYDPQGRLMRITQPTGDYRQFTWTAAGLAASETALDANGTTLARAEWAYDEIDRLTQHRTLARTANGADIGSGWNAQFYTRDRMGRVVAATRGTAIDAFTHDNAGRLVSHVDAAGNSLAATWDADGNLLALAGTELLTADNSTQTGTWSADYDPRGRRIAVRDRRDREGFNTELTMTYDGLDRLTLCMQGDRGCRQHYDLRGRPTDRSDDASGLFSVPIPRQVHDDDDLDFCQSLVPESPAAPVTVTRQFDDRGRLQSVTMPDTGQRTLSYDAAGNLTRCEREDGTVVTQEFDDAGRLTLREVAFADQGLGTLQEEFSYDGMGRLVAGVRTALGVRVESTFQYNSFGIRTGAGQSVYLGQQLLDQREVSDTCDQAGNVVSIGFSDNSSVTLVRDALGRLRGMHAGNEVITTLDWNGPQAPAAAGLPGNVTISRQFEPGATTQVQGTSLQRDGSTLRASAYTWNEQAEFTGVTQAHQAGITSSLIRGGYGQVAQSALLGTNAAAASRQFDFDAWRNLNTVTESIDTTAILTRDYVPDAAHLGRWSSADGVSLGWNAQGCLAQVDDTFIAWDHNHQPMVAAPGSNWQQPSLVISYDVLGRPVLVQRPGLASMALLVYGPDEELREEHRGPNSGFTQSRYFANAGAGCVLQRQNGAWGIRTADAQGSLEALLDADGHRTLQVEYLDDGTPLAQPIALDLDPAGLTLTKPVTGVLKIQTPFDLPSGVTWAGLELETWWQDKDAAFRVVATITAAGPNWLLVDDPDGVIRESLENGNSAQVLDCRYVAGDWSADRGTGLSTLTLATAILDDSFVGGFITPDIDNPCWLEIVQVDVQSATLVARGDVSGLSLGRWRAVKGALAAGLEGERLWHGMRLLGTPNGAQGHARMLWYLDGGLVHVPLLLGRITPDENRPWASRGLDVPADLFAQAVSGPAWPRLPGTTPAMR